jgi:hypothetical protein
MILESLTVGKDELKARTGWDIKPEGACKGQICVPLPPNASTATTVDVTVMADRLGMPLVAHSGQDLWALGPETATTGRSLSTAEAPDLTLPDINGNPVHISDLRPQKVVIVSWASW